MTVALLLRSRVVGLVLGALSLVTVVWIGWAVATPGDFFGNGSSLLLPSLAGAAVIGGAFGSRLAPRLPRLLLLGAAASLAYWAIAPDGWWASPPPGLSRRTP